MASSEETGDRQAGEKIMFKISVAKKEEFDEFKNYMDYSSNGIMLICREEGKITGGICFDLFEKGALIQKMKTDEEAMREIMIKSALNFLDINKIYDVYVKDNNEKIYEMLGFKKDGELMHLNIFGYFGKEHKHG